MQEVEPNTGEFITIRISNEAALEEIATMG